MIKPISFYAEGLPKGQPRPRAFARRFGNKFSARVFDPGTAEAWKGQVAAAAKQFVPAVPLTCPISLRLNFYFPRPKNHYRTGKNAAQLRDAAPNFFLGKPDCDNAAKAVMDALTVIGMWRDDAQVCRLIIHKDYCPENRRPGAQIEISEVVL